MAKRSIHDTVVLRNSVRAPQLGFGVYKSPPDVCVESCRTALESGYRRIDTAQFYANEAQVGLAVKQSGIPRADLFLATKILEAGGSVDRSYDKCVESVGKLDADGYVDQFLIHSPNSGEASRKEMWLALERLYEQGRAKSIGVSNFGIKHLEELKQYATVWPPHANQIEVRRCILPRKNAMLTRAAPPLDAAARDCAVLPGPRHCRRGVLPAGAQLKGRRRHAGARCRPSWRHAEQGPRAICLAEGLGAAAQERHGGAHQGEC